MLNAQYKTSSIHSEKRDFLFESDLKHFTKIRKKYLGVFFLLRMALKLPNWFRPPRSSVLRWCRSVLFFATFKIAIAKMESGNYISIRWTFLKKCSEFSKTAKVYNEKNHQLIGS
jgi:hypothetical protein